MVKISKAEADKILSEAYKKDRLAIQKYCAVRLKYNKSAIDDCVQNTFLVYYKKLLSGEEIQSSRSFLYKTAGNICRQADTRFLRDASKMVDIDEISELPAQDKDLLASELDYDIIKHELLKNLSEKELALYEIRFVKNKSLKEIGELYSVPPNTVAKRISRLRQKVEALAVSTIQIYREGG